MTHRRQFTAALKAQIVLELRSGAKSSVGLGREHQMASSVVAPFSCGEETENGDAERLMRIIKERKSRAMTTAIPERLRAAERLSGRRRSQKRRPSDWGELTPA